jgi:hypothetical protein
MDIFMTESRNTLLSYCTGIFGKAVDGEQCKTNYGI